MKRSAWSGIAGAGELAAVDRCSGSVWRLCNWVVSFETWETRAWIARLETAPCSSWWSMRELLWDKKSLNSDALAGSILVRSFCHGTEARDPIASENRIFIWNTPNTVDVKKSTAVQVQIYRPCRCRSHRQCRCSEPGRAEFTARAENTVRTRQGIHRNVTRRVQPPDLEDWHRELTNHQRNNDLTTHHRNASQI